MSTREHWLPGLVELVTRRPELLGIGVTAVAEGVSS